MNVSKPSCARPWRRPSRAWRPTFLTRRRAPPPPPTSKAFSRTVERKNSWQLAEAAGLANPYRFQHLLGRAQWDAEAVRDAQRQEVLAGLGQEDAVLAIDESGVVKQGTKSAGVARQYCGASGKIDNCQVGVFLSWQTAKGHALSRSGALPAPGVD